MRLRAVVAWVWVLAAAASARADGAAETWASYLDYAYVYSSADPDALAARLGDYGRTTGSSLSDYITEHYGAGAAPSDDTDEVAVRREAIAWLLDHLARGEPTSLEKSVKAIRRLDGRLGRFENRYWYHYILAHEALERGRQYDFVGEVLDLWLHVVVPLESAYESLQTLALSDSENSGFVAALPYVYENTARLVLIRSQRMGMDRGLDPLGAVVRLLGDNRVGAQPDVIPLAASSKEYVDRIVARLDGPESDAGSLTFTLALFEASRLHERARGLLAAEGFSQATLEAIRATAGAYETALDRADTEQGRCAVYTRVLRQLGEIFAARQRLGVDPEIEAPFSIEGAIEVFTTLHKALPDGWAALGYERNGQQAYLDAMHGLWQEIQEATLNTADFYLARAAAEPHAADEHARDAARVLSRHLAVFAEFATETGKEGLPDSAYFAAHEAARGIGDAYLAYALHPRESEVELATLRYRNALEIFPFDRRLWPELTSALERQGRETEYLSLARPVAEWVTRSRSVDAWIEHDEPSAADIAALRRALSDTQVLMYLGFAEEGGIEELEHEREELAQERRRVEATLVDLVRRRDGEAAAAEAVPAALDESPPVGAGESPAASPLERAELTRQITETSALLARLDQQLAARTRALPLYRETLGTESLAPALRAQRDHPVHTLLRRMYHERQP